MYLLEHDAKELLARREIPAPEGCLIANLDELDTSPLPSGPWVVKGQIAAGGRGKAGLVRRAATLSELRAQLGSMLGTTVNGRSVEAARVETAVQGVRETYAGFLLDPAGAGVRVLLSAQGGVDIERAPREQIHEELAAPEAAALEASVERLARHLPRALAPALREAGTRLARAFLEFEALLLEVNPLFVAPGGSWLAGDAKLVTDDNALHRQPELRALVERRSAAYPEVARKLAHGFDYVVVDPEGEIGLLTTGAGLSMMLIDELRAAGLRPYNFLDIRTGGLRGETGRLAQALAWIAEGRRVRVLLVNIFAGITDLGEFARLLLVALGASHLAVPVVARLVGNGLPAAREALAQAGIELHTDLDEALAAVRRHLEK